MSSVKRHGLSIGIERTGNEFFLSLQACGKLTHEDYEVITPIIDSALASVKKPRVKAIIDASELEGWEPRAAWDDFKIGLKHGNQFDKIAIIGNRKWLDLSAKIGSWFISGEAKLFENREEALNWLKNDG